MKDVLLFDACLSSMLNVPQCREENHRLHLLHDHHIDQNISSNKIHTTPVTSSSLHHLTQIRQKQGISNLMENDAIIFTHCIYKWNSDYNPVEWKSPEGALKHEPNHTPGTNVNFLSVMTRPNSLTYQTIIFIIITINIVLAVIINKLTGKY